MESSRNIYRLPISPETVTETVTDNLSHAGSYAGSIDYAVPLGTPVFAAADGTVTRLKDDSEEYGDDPAYGQKVNYVTLRHGDELSEYLHLAKGSVAVHPGQAVRAGDLLGKTGLSGWMTAPHLHFMVYVHDGSPEGSHCRQVRFE